jgi:N4-gp56 family major capsid protein
MALTVSATDSEVPKPVNVAFEQTLLRNARPLAVYFIGSQPGELMEHKGTATIGWRRFNTSADNSSAIAPTTTALSEITGNAAYGMGRTPSTVHRTDATATVAKYGQFFYVNEEVDVFNYNNTMDGIVQTLAISAGRSLNYLHRNVIEDNSTLHYANNETSDALVEDVVTKGDIDYAINILARQYAMNFTPMLNGSQNIGTTPLMPSLWGFCHTDVAYDVAQISGFKSVEQYAGQVATVPGEIGYYGLGGMGVRFISTPEASVDVGAGQTASGDVRMTSSAADLYTLVIKGMNADGSVGLGSALPDGRYVSGENNPGPIKLIVKGKNTSNPSGIDDPFDEMMSVAWKSWYAGKVLNANWAVGIRCAATNLSN